MLTCPLCKNDLPDAPRTCPRCQADLSLLADLVNDVRALLDRAEAHRKAGEIVPAVQTYLAVLILPVAGDGSPRAYAQTKAQPKAQAKASEPYTPHLDSKPRDGVPKGKLTKQPEWKSQIFSDTVRDWWVYVPAQYKADGP